MHRRLWMLCAVTFATGSSGCGKKPRARSGRRPTGPQTMGAMLIDSYIADLKNGSNESRITAARELGNMGPAAKAALPALQPLAKHSDAKVSAAANAAIKAIAR